MAQMNPYLNFHGNTEEAFNFYKDVFGGEFLTLMRLGEAPDIPNREQLSKKALNAVMHVALPIGNNILMGTDTLDEFGQSLTIGNNSHISINTDTKEEAQNIFKKLSQGGNITMPQEDMFWGDFYGSITDKFGIQWMITYTYPKN